jgi:hypothetical protein
MLVPIGYVIAARLYRGHSAAQPLAWVAQTSAAVMLVAVLAATLDLTPEHVVETIPGKPLVALFFAEASLFYALAAAFDRRGHDLYLATATMCGAVWQLLSYQGIDAEYYTLAFAALGLVLLVVYRVAGTTQRVGDGHGPGRLGLAEAAFGCANALLSLSLVTSVLMTLSRLAGPTVRWQMVTLELTMAAVSLAGVGLVRHAAWRRWYVVTTVAQVLLVFVTLQILSHLSYWQKAEIASLLIGAALLVAAHVGWHREDERQSDLVNVGLLLGCLLVGIPLVIGVMAHRSRPEFTGWDLFNEVGLLVAGLALLSSGFMLELKTTTLCGGAMMALYLLTLFAYVRLPEKLQTTGAMMAIAGGVLFAVGLLLSIYRDRLLALPEQVKRRQGVFRILNWR